jgi:hypothetical protein
MTLLDISHNLLDGPKPSALTVLYGAPAVVLLILLLTGREALRVAAPSAVDRSRHLFRLAVLPLFVIFGFVVVHRVVLLT